MFIFINNFAELYPSNVYEKHISLLEKRILFCGTELYKPTQPRLNISTFHSFQVWC